MKSAIKFYFLTSLLVYSRLLCASDWIEQTHSTMYLFAPGIHSSEREVAKYCTSFQTSTGQVAFTEHSFSVLGRQVYPVIFAGIVPSLTDLPSFQFKDLFSWKKLLNHFYHKATLLRNDYHDRKEGITVEQITDPNNTFNAAQHGVWLEQINLAQEGDVALLGQKYTEIVSLHPTNDIVLYGVSRGAATSFNFLATEYQNQKNKKIKAAVLEGCFDSVKHIVHQKFPPCQKIPTLKSLAEKCFSLVYTGHNLDGMAPIKVVNDFPHDIPVLFVTSKIDKVVPSIGTWNLYNALKNTGHPNVYILELKHSAHPRYMMDNEYDRLFYESAVHAFYKRYGIPYNPEKVMLGEVILAQCQP